MAVEGYEPLAVPGGCVDSSDINQWLQNLNQLAFGALQEIQGLSCSAIEGAIDPGECLEIDRGTSIALNPTDGDANRIEKKIFLGPVSIRVNGVSENVLFNDYDLDDLIPQQNRLVTYAIVALCDGVPFATSTQFTQPAGSLINADLTMTGECPRDSKLELCINVINTTLPPGVEIPGVSAVFCAAVLCIAEPYTSLLSEIDGFCCAPDVPEGCRIGREGVFLLQQNLSSLYAFLSRGYLESECSFSDTFNDDQPHTIYQSQHDIQYLFVGSARICAVNTERYLSGEIEATMSVSCSNGSTTSCLPVTQFFEDRLEDGLTSPEICFTVPIVACGNCLAGGDITAGLNFTVRCGDSQVETTAGIQVTSVEQNMTLFTWRLVDPYAEGLLSIYESQPIDKKIKRSAIEYFVERADEAFDYICNIQDLETDCQRRSGSYSASNTGGVLGTGIIRDINPGPFPGPIPVNKTTVLCTIQVCLENTSDFVPQQVTIDIKLVCPGQPDYVISTTCVVPPPFWFPPDPQVDPVAQGSGENTVCKTIPLQTTFADCPINVPLSLEIETSATNVPVNITAEYDCLTFNV